MFIRAIVVGMIAKRRGEEAAANEIVKEERNGFRFVGALSERLKEYEGNRATFRTLADFYPRLRDVFESVSSRATPGNPDAPR